MSDKVNKILIFAIIIGIIVGGSFIIANNVKQKKAKLDETNMVESRLQREENTVNENVSKKQSTDLEVVPTMIDEIGENSSWCGTFQLVWNDMKDAIVKKDVVFTPQIKMVENLNKADFNERMISEDYYYKIYGIKTLALKEKIEKGIKEKFNQESDILDDIDWSKDALDNPNDLDTRRYLFYTMLYRKFDFLKKFDKLEDGTFGNESKTDVKYFGIDEDTDKEVLNQVRVLYYNSKDDFALLINTKSDDEVIFCKNPKGTNFKEIYNSMMKSAEQYQGSKKLNESDRFKAPNLEFNVKREYEELENKIFKTADGGDAEIAKAIQSIKLKLDENGGEIKSEAAIDMKVTNAMAPIDNKPRFFYLDDTFALFLKEKSKDSPYFAAKVTNIEKFQ